MYTTTAYSDPGEPATVEHIEIVRPSYTRKFKQIKDFKTKFVTEPTVKKVNRFPDTIIEGKILTTY